MLHVRRREVIKLLGGMAVVWPFAARAQQPERIRRIGVLMMYAESDAQAQALVAVFRAGLRDLGWTEDHKIRLDYRWATSDSELIQRSAKELVALQPVLILSSSTPTTASLLQQTRTIPIIFANIVDPVGSGFVASLPRPGGNVTGFLNLETSMTGKWLELLKEIAPRVARVAIVFNPSTAPYAEIYLTPFNAAAASLGMETIVAPVRDMTELDTVIAAQARDPNGGLMRCQMASCSPITRRLPRWRLAIGSPPSLLTEHLPKLAACCPTEMTSSIIIDVRRLTRTEF